MPSVAYRLALASGGRRNGQCVACACRLHNIVAGQAQLIGAEGVLIDQVGNSITCGERRCGYRYLRAVLAVCLKHVIMLSQRG